MINNKDHRKETNNMLTDICDVCNGSGTPILETTYEYVANGKPIKATDFFVDMVDQLLDAKELKKLKALLATMDVSRVPPQLLTAVLALTRPYQKHPILSEARERFFERVVQKLHAEPDYEQARIDAISERLR